MKKQMIGMVLAALTAGCSTDRIHSWMRQEAAELTDFLPGKERLVRQPDTFPVHFTWADLKAIEKADFKCVYVAPVNLSYLRKGNGYDEWRNKVAGLDDAVNELGEYGRRSLSRVASWKTSPRCAATSRSASPRGRGSPSWIEPLLEIDEEVLEVFEEV